MVPSLKVGLAVNSSRHSSFAVSFFFHCTVRAAVRAGAELGNTTYEVNCRFSPYNQKE